MISELVGRAVELSRGHGGRALLGVTGPPGAGKSTLAATLVDAVPGAVALGMDGFHLADVELRRLGLAERKGAPDTFDAAGFVAALTRVRRGEDVYLPVFDRHLDDPVGGAHLVPAGASLVVVEGNYLLLAEPPWEEVRPLLHECWYLDVPDPLRERWLVGRHRRFGESQERALAHAQGSDAVNAVLVETTRARAELVVTAPW